jgi:hypothetical protein
MQVSLTRLLFLVSAGVWVAIGVFLPRYSHRVVGANEVYRCGWGAIVMVAGVGLTLAGFGWYVWRRKQDNSGLVFLVAIPLLGYVFVPELVTTRVELTPTRLIHHRKLINGSIEVNLAFSDVSAAYEVRRVSANDGSALSGYVLGLKNGSAVEIPTNEVVTGARERINARLTAAGAPPKAIEVHHDEDHKVAVKGLLRLLAARSGGPESPAGTDRR